eukprot:5351095-Amphidinium_carterae.1
MNRAARPKNWNPTGSTPGPKGVTHPTKTRNCGPLAHQAARPEGLGWGFRLIGLQLAIFLAGMT